jgi:hypothetical protein
LLRHGTVTQRAQLWREFQIYNYAAVCASPCCELDVAECASTPEFVETRGQALEPPPECLAVWRIGQV